MRRYTSAGFSFTSSPKGYRPATRTKRMHPHAQMSRGRSKPQTKQKGGGLEGRTHAAAADLGRGQAHLSSSRHMGSRLRCPAPPPAPCRPAFRPKETAVGSIRQVYIISLVPRMYAGASRTSLVFGRLSFKKSFENPKSVILTRGVWTPSYLTTIRAG